MSRLRDAMREEAGRVWRDKARAESFGLFMNEETITETALLHLAMQFQGRDLSVRPFTKAQETKNGADWEFWFVQGVKGIGLRVQAKRLFPSGTYQSLAPRGRQTFLLLKRSDNCYPVFVFYNDERSYNSPFPVCGCGNYRRPSYRGCTLTPAWSVFCHNSHDSAYLAQHTIPWHCLLCSSAASKSKTLPHVVAESLNKLLTQSATTLPRGRKECKVILLPDEIRKFAGPEFRASDRLQRDRVYREPDWLAEYLEARALAGVAVIVAEGDS